MLKIVQKSRHVKCYEQTLFWNLTPNSTHFITLTLSLPRLLCISVFCIDFYRLAILCTLGPPTQGISPYSFVCTFQKGWDYDEVVTWTWHFTWKSGEQLTVRGANWQSDPGSMEWGQMWRSSEHRCDPVHICLELSYFDCQLLKTQLWWDKFSQQSA